jgi:predicted GNAT family acetyltransferase
MNINPRWRKISGSGIAGIEEFLKAREPYCVAACSRFLGRNPKRDHVWALSDTGGGLRALLIHSRRSLLPVFNGWAGIPAPRFMRRFLLKAPIHAIQGLCRDAEILEKAVAELGYKAAENINYHLMALDKEPCSEAFKAGPEGLRFRKPVSSDMDELFQLQIAYEQEEVLPAGAVFNSVSCYITLEHIVAKERILIAELDSRIVGKINTSGASFSRYQIGGVYVHPDFRGRGIATRMGAVFIRDLIAEGRGITLFVKKRNLAALSVYRRIGFEVLRDYRISYY